MTNVTITFDDAAANFLTANAPTNGSYKPTQFANGITFSVPAPPGPYATNLAVFTGTNPNGAWSLYVQDDNPLDSGAISNGWSLAFTTAAPVIGSADLGVAVVASPDPVVATSNLTYTVSATNFGPAGATGVFLTNTLPPGVGYKSSSLLPSSVATNGGQVTLVYSLNSVTTNGGVVVTNILAANAGTVVTINATAPVASGPITNLAIVTADQPDANPVDNLAATITGVSSATADLAIGLTGSPDPVSLGGTLVYNISVTNLGPASAIAVQVTDVLPAGMNFISASGGGTFNAGTVTFNLGVMGSGAVSRVVLTVQPTAGGTFTNTVTVASSIGDPFKSNNRASAKTVVQGTVQPVQLSAALTPGGPAFTWPVSAGNYVLEYTLKLVPSAWSAVTNPAPVVVNGQNTITPGLPGFYRLRATIP